MEPSRPPGYECQQFDWEVMLTSSVREWTGVGGRIRKDLSLSLGHSELLSLDPSQIPHGVVELFRLRIGMELL